MNQYLPANVNLWIHYIYDLQTKFSFKFPFGESIPIVYHNQPIKFTVYLSFNCEAWGIEKLMTLVAS